MGSSCCRGSCLWVSMLILACLLISLNYPKLVNYLNYDAFTKVIDAIGLVLCIGSLIRISIKIAVNLNTQRLAHTFLPSNNNLMQISQAVDNPSILSAEGISTHPVTISAIPDDLEFQLQDNWNRSILGVEVQVNTSQHNLICRDPSLCAHVLVLNSGIREDNADMDSTNTRVGVCVCMQHLDKSGKIERLSRVYSGASSDVYKGTLLNNHGVTSTLVALKTIRIRTRPEKTHDDARLHRRFTKMLRLSSQLNHPNITPLLGFSMACDMDDLPILIFPWYSSGNVVQYLNRNPTASRPHLFQDVVRGLEYIHSLSLVHADIKGENILVNDAGSACLADFGISSFIQANNTQSACNLAEGLLPASSNTSSSVSGGTLPFLSPEELSKCGRKQMPSDIWKVGCTAIQIIAGKTPYEGTTIHCDLVLKIIGGIPPMDVQQCAASPEERYLWDIIVRCWNLNPDSRPSAVILRAQIEKTVEIYFPTRALPQ
ncbi:hypothetical protein FRC02_005339 [Tulasnella sp. 418]|nr:hypothetical protein FRC02_005339 [Tulasnella sp. 418]